MKSKTKLLLLSLSASCYFFVACSGYAEAAPQKTYQIGEKELTQLEQNLTTLKNHNKTYSEELTKQQAELKASKAELTLLHSELKTLQDKSQATEQLLKNANLSFELYAKEQQSKIKKAKRQRNLYIFLSACLAYAFVQQSN